LSLDVFVHAEVGNILHGASNRVDVTFVNNIHDRNFGIDLFGQRQGVPKRGQGVIGKINRHQYFFNVFHTDPPMRCVIPVLHRHLANQVRVFLAANG
jgi:hypothetical protein